jgi:DNA helicase-2/ATP-dependent DNA helicase PcrA
MNLDPQQKRAVQTDSKSALVIAGAGSGKTRVLTERIAYLIEECKVSPSEILSFTFTRKAAQEMEERLATRTGSKARGINMGTMHGVALRMLGRFGEIVGLRPSSITIYSEWESAFLLKEVATDIGLFKKSWKVPKKDIDAMFSAYYERGEEPDEHNPAKRLFDAFMVRCRENNAMTYGGLLMGLRLLIPTMAKYLHIRHILVDEVQDIDPLQWTIINEMRKAFGASLFCVGDIRQSIYSFRGAVPEYLLQHQRDFTIFELQSNYRSVPPIVESANRLMEHGKEFLGGGMLATREDGSFYLLGSSHLIIQRDADSAAMAAIIERHREDPYLSKFAVLARNHTLLRKLSAELDARQVPSTYIGRKSSLTNMEEFRRFHAFLKLFVNPYDNFSFLLIKDLIGLSPSRYSDVRVNAAMDGTNHFQTWFKKEKDDHAWGHIFREGHAWTLYDLAGNIESMFGPSMSDWIGDTDYRPPFDFEPALNFVWSWCHANPLGTIRQYLDWLAVWDIQDEISQTEGITLCTIHAAKGLEWPVVIVAGCNEGILPSKQAISAGEIEEERRLFYVAITRARDQLILTVRPEVTETEDGRRFENPASRFISDQRPNCPAH